MGSYVRKLLKKTSHSPNINHCTSKMNSLLLMTLFIGLCSSIPIPDSPYGNAFLNVRVVQQHHGGAQTGLGLSVSKQKVSKLKVTPEGEIVEEEPFEDHKPPFLALPPVEPLSPLPLPGISSKYAKTS